VAIAAGASHSLALKADGTVVGWGHNNVGQAQSPAGLSNVVAIAAGSYHSLALKADGTVVGWGKQLGQAQSPAGLSNVVAIAAGSYHSLALKADGTVVGWGSGYGQTKFPPVNILNLALARTGAVDVNVPGSYELTYTTTNAFGPRGSQAHDTGDSSDALVTTRPATDVGSTGATLHGEVNPRGTQTLAWCEYGLTTKYGSSTGFTNLGSYPYHLGISHPVTNLLPWLTYHFRAVASNSVGRINGLDMTVTLPGPFGPGTAPWLSDMAGITIPQGGNTNIPFAVTPGALDVRGRCNNPVLLPTAGIGLTGLSANRWLNLVPDPNHSGAAQITVTASDGTHAVSDTFTLTVTPSANSGGGTLRLTDVAASSPQSWRFGLEDSGSGSTNYTVEYQSELSPTSAWILATNVTDLGGGVFEVHTGPPQGKTGFYRVKGIRWLTASLDSPRGTMDESTACGAVVVFNGLYHGSVNYTWGGTEGPNSGSVQVNGSTAVIPIPPSFVSDDARIDPLKYLTLRLEGGPGYATAGSAESGITIEENDAEWQGTLIIPSGIAGTTSVSLTNHWGSGYTNVTLPQTADITIGFKLKIQETNGGFQGQLQSDGYGFFPTSALTQLTMTGSRFAAVATQVALPALEGSALFNQASHVDVRLDADNARTNQSVDPQQIAGVATLVSVVPGRPYLDTLMSGTFLLFKTATTSPTNAVPLTSAR
jgi:hypothetical protein